MPRFFGFACIVALLAACGDDGVEGGGGGEGLPRDDVAIEYEGVPYEPFGYQVLLTPEAAPKLQVLGQIGATIDGADVLLVIQVPPGVSPGVYPLERVYTLQADAPRAFLTRVNDPRVATTQLLPLSGELDLREIPSQPGDRFDARVSRAEFQDLCGDTLTLVGARLVTTAQLQTDVLPSDALVKAENIATEARAHSFARLELPEVALIESPGDLAVVNRDTSVGVVFRGACPAAQAWRVGVFFDDDLEPATWDPLLSQDEQGNWISAGPQIYLLNDRGNVDTADDLIWFVGLGQVTVEENEGYRGRFRITIDEPSDAVLAPESVGVENPFPEPLQVGTGFVEMLLTP